MPSHSLADVVQLDRYPLHESTAEPTRELINTCTQQLAQTGCAHVPGMLTSGAVRRMCAVTRDVGHLAYHSTTRHNPYFTDPDAALDEDDPRQFYQERSTAIVARDQMPDDALVHTLHHWPPFISFLKACLGVRELYPFLDPINGVTINMMHPGDVLPWHFDTNEFTVSLVLQKSDDGGWFEYVSNTRTPRDERFAEVAEVLKGDRSRVISVDMEPGDLQLFKGRYSLHRVSRVEGMRPRFTSILSYALMPNYVARAGRIRKIYGRCLPIHLDAERVRADELID